MYLLAHTEGAPARQINPVRLAVRELDPNTPVDDVQTLREYFAASLYPFRVLGINMGACGSMALLLAVIGIYGIVSYAATQRTREVGIRMALGALKTDILKLVVSQGMVPVGLGLALGLLLSIALARVLTSSMFETELLFGVSSTDSLTFGGVTIVLAIISAIACYVPALRAAKVDLIDALRYQ